MYSPIFYSSRAGYSFLYARATDRSLLEILFSLIIAALIAALTFVPLVAAGNDWFFFF